MINVSSVKQKTKKYVILNLNRIASRPNDTKSYLQNLSNALFRYILENILLKKQFILKTLDS